MNYILGDNIGFRETLEIELKEFMLKLDPLIYFDDREIYNIITTGNLQSLNYIERFNSMILDNINHYFKYYIPRYISVFGTSDINNAELYIGISDLGEITGIPFFGNLPKWYIDTFLSSIKPFILIDDKNIIVDDVLSKIGIEIIPVSKDISYLDNSIETIIQDFIDKKNKYEKEYFDNLTLRRKWKEEIDYYTTKIRDYFNKKEYRTAVAEFIKKDKEAEKYEHIIELLESDKVIDIGDYGEISFRKLNKNDVVHWITEFKDKMVESIKDKKPAKINYINFSYNIYSTQFSVLSNMRYKFCNSNENLNYYLIKIKLPTKVSDRIYFKTSDSDSWMQRTRAFINGSPGCY